ncbi:hypothetical protein [Actinomycetospora flava]|uniref:Uncharacterized protein n=1 Tax=Actinomycetospora flava TaxID=3129232 RepID=A0ABU8M2E0_9PSEU
MPLRTIPVALDQLPLVAAGPCEPQNVWEEQNGRRVLTDRQETDPDTGERLWSAYVMPVGTDRPEVLQVRVRADQQPVVTQFAPVTFDSLEVNVRVGKDGRLAQYFAGRGLRDAAQPGRKNGQDHKQHEGQPA